MILGEIVPKVQFAVVGSTITLKCESEYLLTWHYLGTKLEEGRKLILRNLSPSHSGRYNCRGTRDYEESFEEGVVRLYVAGN